MAEFITANRDLITAIVQLMLLVSPLVIIWLVREYIKNIVVEKQVGSIIQLANSAIDYVENLDKSGRMVVPPDVKKGVYKLKLAAGWLESELQRNKIQVTQEDASKWISSEFQKRVGDVKPTQAIHELTSLAVDLIQGLLKNSTDESEIQSEHVEYLTGLASDWLVTQMLRQYGVTITPEEAKTWVRAELLQRLQVKRLTSGDRLADLARQAVAFVNDLKASGRLALRSAGAGSDVESDVAIAWMLTEAARLGMSATSEEIADIVNTILRQRNSKPA